jgi:hypothetical protein
MADEEYEDFVEGAGESDPANPVRRKPTLDELDMRSAEPPSVEDTEEMAGEASDTRPRSRRRRSRPAAPKLQGFEPPSCCLTDQQRKESIDDIRRWFEQPNRDNVGPIVISALLELVTDELVRGAYQRAYPDMDGSTATDKSINWAEESASGWARLCKNELDSLLKADEDVARETMKTVIRWWRGQQHDARPIQNAPQLKLEQDKQKQEYFKTEFGFLLERCTDQLAAGLLFRSISNYGRNVKAFRLYTENRFRKVLDQKPERGLEAGNKDFSKRRSDELKQEHQMVFWHSILDRVVKRILWPLLKKDGRVYLQTSLSPELERILITGVFQSFERFSYRGEHGLESAIEFFKKACEIALRNQVRHFDAPGSSSLDQPTFDTELSYTPDYTLIDQNPAPPRVEKPHRSPFDLFVMKLGKREHAIKFWVLLKLRNIIVPRASGETPLEWKEISDEVKEDKLEQYEDHFPPACGLQEVKNAFPEKDRSERGANTPVALRRFYCRALQQIGV